MSAAGELVQSFVDFNENMPERMRKLKARTGMKMIGWTCNYVPVELIMAAGMIPVRILGRPQAVTLADASLQSFACNVSRSYLDQLLRGQLDFLDGVVTPKICDPLMYAHDIQKRHNCCDFSHFIQMPSEVLSVPSKIWLDKDLAIFRESLEEFSGNRITDESIRGAVERCNRMRSLVRKLYRMRKADNPPIYGNEVLQVVLAGMTAPTEEYVRDLSKLLENLSKAGPLPKEKIRLMAIGSTVDFTEMDLLREFEATRGVFVTDDMCTGTRWAFWNIETGNGADPFSSVVDAYHTSRICAGRHPGDLRLETVVNLAVEYRVQGIVIILEKFCDVFGFATPDTEKMLKSKGFPTLVIESAEVSALGQVRTRAQGFFEVIAGV